MSVGRENPRYVQEIMSFLTGPVTEGELTTHKQKKFAASSSSAFSTMPSNPTTDLDASSTENKVTGQSLIEEVLSSMTEAMVYLPSSSNMDTNRKLWDNYAKNWNHDEEW